MLCLTQSIKRAVRLFGAAPALSYGDHVSTWNEFAQRVAKLAGAMRSAGLKVGDRVGVLDHNSDRYIEILYAVFWAGGIVVPLNYRLTASEINRQIDEFGLKIIFLGAESLISLDRITAANHAKVIDIWGARPSDLALAYTQFLDQGEEIDDTSPGNDATAAIFLTSGTTGASKGVMLSHSNLYINAAIMQSVPAYHRHTVHLTMAPFFHIAAASRIFTVAMAGGHHHVMAKFDMEEMRRQIAKYRITSIQMVPTMIARLLDSESFNQQELSSLTDIGYGSAPIHDKLLRALQERLPSVRLTQHYGMTELSPAVTALMPEDHRITDQGCRRQSVGRVLPTAEIMIADADDRELARGEVGEILARGPMVMKGYWNRPQDTATALRGGWMHTGDVGYLDDEGYLYVVDRIKDMIISGGENIYSLEVENVLNLHPAVIESAVVGLSDPEWGERVHAVVVCRAGMEVSEWSLRDHCRGLLAGYKCPKTYEFRTELLSRSTYGKIMKGDLRRSSVG